MSVFTLTDRGGDLWRRSVLVSYFVLVDLQPVFHPLDDASELLVRVFVDDDGRRRGLYFSEVGKYQSNKPKKTNNLC